LERSGSSYKVSRVKLPNYLFNFESLGYLRVEKVKVALVYEYFIHKRIIVGSFQKLPKQYRGCGWFRECVGCRLCYLRDGMS
jgi:hypothetical protein